MRGCNLRGTATCCNTLQHAATRCNTHATHCNTDVWCGFALYETLQDAATRCNNAATHMQHTAIQTYDAGLHSTRHCNILQCQCIDHHHRHHLYTSMSCSYTIQYQVSYISAPRVAALHYAHMYTQVLVCIHTSIQVSSRMYAHVCVCINPFTEEIGLKIFGS